MSLAQEKAQLEISHAAEIKWRDAAHIQIQADSKELHATELRSWEAAAVQTELEWKEFHAAEIRDRDTALEQEKADSKKHFDAMANDFYNRLHAEREQTRAAQFTANSNFHLGRDLEKKLHARECQISGLQDEVKQVRFDKKHGEENSETVLGVHKGVNMQLRTQVRTLEGEKKDTKEAHEQKLSAVQKGLEGANNEIGRLSEINELLRDRLARQQASEAKKNLKITDLSQQAEKSNSALDEKKAEMEKMGVVNEKRITDLDQQVEALKVWKMRATSEMATLDADLEECKLALVTKTAEKLLLRSLL